jgi:LytS/YehU family sensor histidine kinase
MLIAICVLMGSGGGFRYELIVIFVYFGVLNILIFYINYLWILPEVLVRKNYLHFLGFLLLLLAAGGLAKYGLAVVFKEYVLINEKTKVRMPFGEYFLHTILVSVFMIFISSAVKFMVEWFTTDKKNKSLEKEKLSAELAFLKSQINPHFLLNSLNNLYSLAYQKSEKTPGAVLKLSEIMRYMLYESNDKKVEIGNEVRYLENYIELQKIRFKDSVFVDFTVACDHDEQAIEPLILIPFIENAFKHGLITDPQNPVKIDVVVNDARLHFRVSNRKTRHNKDETGGIGLSNIQRRLALLYPGRHSLVIIDEPETYTCELSLDLS